MISGCTVAETARGWAGTPFRHQASLKGVGVDCIGLVTGVADELGFPEAKAWRSDLNYRGYGRQPEPIKLIRACNEYMDKISNPTVGDVLLFAFQSLPMHFGIIVSENPRYIVHAYSPLGHVAEHRMDEKWDRRVVGAYRLRGVAWPP
jgi:NlpC/P60 family putative phage cell wall peptidase